MKKSIKHSASTLQVIGGKFRSRKIIFFEEAGLRPTHNRIRETLFNWLTPVIENSFCLDVFAGSGSLGFEAISRGAQHVTFCDTSRKVIHTLKENAEKLQIENAEFLNIDFTLENRIKNKKFDIVFLDPPFQKNLLLKTIQLIISRDLLNPDALIYFECEKNGLDLSALPKNMSVKKHKKTQTIEYGILEHSGSTV